VLGFEAQPNLRKLFNPHSLVKIVAYNNFSLQDAISQFDLNLIESAFCEALPPASPKPEFLNIFEQYLPLAQKAKSEKAKSELLVSPILVELLRLADTLRLAPNTPYGEVRMVRVFVIELVLYRHDF
jgi:hypothetical protein